MRAMIDLYGLIPLEMLKTCTLNEIRVYGALSSFQGNNDKCWPSRKEISSRSGIRETTISETTNSLEKKNWIAKTQRGKRQSNIYRCLFPISEVRKTSTIPESEVLKSGTSEVLKSGTSINENTQLKEQIIYTWNNQSSLINHSLKTASRHLISKYINIINEIGVDKVIKAIENYGKFCSLPQDDFWFTYRVWTLWDFIGRGVHRFLDEAKPLETLKKEKGKSPVKGYDFKKILGE
jgi:DNA-binding MarR family transcriptional regulator